MSETFFEYSPPRELHPDLWELAGTWKNKFGRRMTVVRRPDQSLMIHNAMKLHERELDWLRKIGNVAMIVGPNTFHCSDVEWMAGKFPHAQVYVPDSKIAAYKAKGIQAFDVNKNFPNTNALFAIPMLGTRMKEAAFVHSPSKTLILCDLAFNMGDVFTGVEKKLMRWNLVHDRFGPSRLTKWLFASDKRQLLDSYRHLLDFDFDRVIVNHGDVLESGGKERLKSSVAEVFGAP